MLHCAYVVEGWSIRRTTFQQSLIDNEMKLTRIAFLVVSLCQLLQSDAFVPVKDLYFSPTVCHLLPHERIVSRGSIPSRSGWTPLCHQSTSIKSEEKRLRTFLLSNLTPLAVTDKRVYHELFRSKDSKDSQVEDDGYSTTKNPLISLLSKMNPRKTEPGYRYIIYEHCLISPIVTSAFVYNACVKSPVN